MTHPLSDLRVLDRYKAAPFPPGYPTGYRTFYAPVDDVPNVLLYLLESARASLVVAMFGFADPKLADVLQQNPQRTVLVEGVRPTHPGQTASGRCP